MSSAEVELVMPAAMVSAARALSRLVPLTTALTSVTLVRAPFMLARRYASPESP